MATLGEEFTEKEIQDMIAEADLNGDGLINFEGTNQSFKSDSASCLLQARFAPQKNCPIIALSYYPHHTKLVLTTFSLRSD